MRCDTVKELYSDYMEGKLARPLALTFEQHLAECADCNEEYQQFKCICVALDDLPEVTPPSMFRNQVMARIARERVILTPQQKPAGLFNWGSIFGARVPARAFAAAFVLLLFVALAVQMGQQPNVVKAPVIGPPQIQQSWPTTSNDLGRGNTGLNISVMPLTGSKNGTYQIRIEPKSSDVPDVRLYLLPVGQSFFTQKALAKAIKLDTPIFTGRPFISTSGPGTAYLEWYFEGKRFAEAMFMPSKMSQSPDKKADLDATETTFYVALADVSQTYGVVIVVDADLGTGSINRVIVDGTAGKALTEILADVEGSSVHWEKLQDTVYAINRE